MNIIEFNGDPMMELEKFEDMDKYIFYLNQESLNEIKSYSDELNDDIPQFFSDKRSDFIFFAKGGVDEKGNEFPDTYIGVNYTHNEEYPYTFSGIYASDLQYTKPENGEEIFLKKTDLNLQK